MSVKWVARARCRDYDPRVMDNIYSEYAISKAKAICSHCSVFAQCRAYVDSQETGMRKLNHAVISCVYAGETPQERVARRRAQARHNKPAGSHTQRWHSVSSVAKKFNVPNYTILRFAHSTGLPTRKDSHRVYLSDEIFSPAWQARHINKYWELRLGLPTTWILFSDIFHYTPVQLKIQSHKNIGKKLVATGSVEFVAGRGLFIDSANVTPAVIDLVKAQCKYVGLPFIFHEEKVTKHV